jgi:hypothetical protein
MVKKLFWVLLGLVLAAGAIFLATDRHYWDQQRSTPRYSSTRATNPTQRTPDSQARSATRSTPTQTSSAGTTWSFDTIINILNVVVGVLGIWMTIHGMRMQRAALAAASRGQR